MRRFVYMLALAVVADRLRAAGQAAKLPGFFLGRIGADQFGLLLPTMN